MGVRLDGKTESIKLKARLAARVSRISQGVKPGLSVVLVGGNLASETFVKIKKRFGEEIGARVKVYKVASQKVNKANNPRLRGLIQRLNNNKAIAGILLQLPLPKGLQAQEHIDLIDRSKDVDGLRKDSLMRSPVAEAVRHLLKKAFFECHSVLDTESKNKKQKDTKSFGVSVGFLDSSSKAGMTDRLKGVLLVKSDEFANSLLKSLSTFPVKWKVERVTSRDMRSHVSTMRRCDIVISALGFPRAITPNMIKRGAIIIDVGFTKVKGEIMGDFHPDCYERSSFYSPVPGGVGPLTVAYVFKNLMKLCRFMK